MATTTRYNGNSGTSDNDITRVWDRAGARAGARARVRAFGTAGTSVAGPAGHLRGTSVDPIVELADEDLLPYQDTALAGELVLVSVAGGSRFSDGHTARAHIGYGALSVDPITGDWSINLRSGKGE